MKLYYLLVYKEVTPDFFLHIFSFRGSEDAFKCSVNNDNYFLSPSLGGVQTQPARLKGINSLQEFSVSGKQELPDSRSSQPCH